jgi:hypothetical protein
VRTEKKTAEGREKPQISPLDGIAGAKAYDRSLPACMPDLQVLTQTLKPAAPTPIVKTLVRSLSLGGMQVPGLLSLRENKKKQQVPTGAQRSGGTCCFFFLNSSKRAIGQGFL